MILLKNLKNLKILESPHFSTISRVLGMQSEEILNKLYARHQIHS